MEAADIIAIAEEAVDVPPGSFKPDTRISDVEEWTSLAWLGIISLLDERAGVLLDAKMIRQFQTVQNVIDWVQAQPKEQA